MNEQEILNLKKCVVAENAIKKTIDVSVYHVARGCFNDEMLIESASFNVSEIKGKDLIWFDLYLGRKSDNKIKISIAYIEKEYIHFLFDDGESVKVVKNAYSVLACDDLNESSLIATHIW